MAFSRADDYAIGPNETEMIASYVPGTSVVRLNTRPRSGGELTVTLNGAVNASASLSIIIKGLKFCLQRYVKTQTKPNLLFIF